MLERHNMIEQYKAPQKLRVSNSDLQGTESFRQCQVYNFETCTI